MGKFSIVSIFSSLLSYLWSLTILIFRLLLLFYHGSIVCAEIFAIALLKYTLGLLRWVTWPLPSRWARKRAIWRYLRRMWHAETFEEWLFSASKLDELEGAAAWRREKSGKEYDRGLIETTHKRLSRLRASGDTAALLFHLRSVLSHRYGGIANPELYQRAYTGTKHAVEKFIAEVCACLETIADAPESVLPAATVAEFFDSARLQLGRTALSLSGGGALAMSHLGVVRSLLQAGLLPRVISGASGGSIIAALMAAHTDDELLSTILTPEMLTMQYTDRERIRNRPLNSYTTHREAIASLEDRMPPPNMRFLDPLPNQVIRFIRTAITTRLTAPRLMEGSDFASAVRQKLGDLTFLEAWNRTGRIVNITVVARYGGGGGIEAVSSEGSDEWVDYDVGSIDDSYSSPKSNIRNTAASSGDSGGFTHTLVLNYLTAPDVLLWSAVSASCALPGLMRPVSLMAKKSNNKIVPFHPPGLHSIDGSLNADVPTQQLAIMFHAQRFIVSQTNPHVVPFLEVGGGSARGGPRTSIDSGILPRILRTAAMWLDLDARHRAAILAKMQLLPRFFGEDFNNVLAQSYDGYDVLIIPPQPLFSVIKAVQQPSTHDLARYIHEGERATWPHLPHCRVLLAVEKTLSVCVRRIAQRQLERLGTKKIAKSLPSSASRPSFFPENKMLANFLTSQHREGVPGSGVGSNGNRNRGYSSNAESESEQEPLVSSQQPRFPRVVSYSVPKNIPGTSYEEAILAAGGARLNYAQYSPAYSSPTSLPPSQSSEHMDVFPNRPRRKSSVSSAGSFGAANHLSRHVGIREEDSAYSEDGSSTRHQDRRNASYSQFLGSSPYPHQETRLDRSFTTHADTPTESENPMPPESCEDHLDLPPIATDRSPALTPKRAGSASPIDLKPASRHSPSAPPGAASPTTSGAPRRNLSVTFSPEVTTPSRHVSDRTAQDAHPHLRRRSVQLPGANIYTGQQGMPLPIPTITTSAIATGAYPMSYRTTPDTVRAQDDVTITSQFANSAHPLGASPFETHTSISSQQRMPLPAHQYGAIPPAVLQQAFASPMLRGLFHPDQVIPSLTTSADTSCEDTPELDSAHMHRIHSTNDANASGLYVSPDITPLITPRENVLRPGSLPQLPRTSSALPRVEILASAYTTASPNPPDQLDSQQSSNATPSQDTNSFTNSIDSSRSVSHERGSKQTIFPYYSQIPRFANPSLSSLLSTPALRPLAGHFPLGMRGQVPGIQTPAQNSFPEEDFCLLDSMPPANADSALETAHIQTIPAPFLRAGLSREPESNEIHSSVLAPPESSPPLRLVAEGPSESSSRIHSRSFFHNQDAAHDERQSVVPTLGALQSLLSGGLSPSTPTSEKAHSPDKQTQSASISSVPAFQKSNRRMSKSRKESIESNVSDIRVEEVEGSGFAGTSTLSDDFTTRKRSAVPLFVTVPTEQVGSEEDCETLHLAFPAPAAGMALTPTPPSPLTISNPDANHSYRPSPLSSEATTSCESP